MRSAEPLAVEDALHGGGSCTAKHCLACLRYNNAHCLSRALLHDWNTPGVVNRNAVRAVFYANDFAQLLEIWIGKNSDTKFQRSRSANPKAEKAKNNTPASQTNGAAYVGRCSPVAPTSK